MVRNQPGSSLNSKQAHTEAGAAKPEIDILTEHLTPEQLTDGEAVSSTTREYSKA